MSSRTTLSPLYADTLTVCADCLLAVEDCDEDTPSHHRLAGLYDAVPTALSFHGGDQTDEFSRTACDGCGTCRGGVRYALVALRPRTPEDEVQPADVPDEMVDGYLDAARYYPEDAPAGLPWDDLALAHARATCASFLTAVLQAGGAEDLTPLLTEPTRAGHDLWLTSNGHGAGFWGGGWPEPAGTAVYTPAAKAEGVTCVEAGSAALGLW